VKETSIRLYFQPKMGPAPGLQEKK